MLIVDPFETAVTRALQQLRDREGRDISWRELSRRAGWDDRWGKFDNAVHGRREQKPGGQRTGGRRVPRELVEDLVKVLPVTAVELHAAAARTAGYDVDIAFSTGPDDVLVEVKSYLDDPDVSAEERERRAREVLEMVQQHGEARSASVVEFPRRRLLTEAGAAARDGDEPEMSDPDETVH